jgi:hypothetical protein
MNKLLIAASAALLLAGCNDKVAKYMPWETAKFKESCEFKRGFSDAALRKAYNGRPLAGKAPLGAVATFAVAIKPAITLEQSATCFEPIAQKPVE